MKIANTSYLQKYHHCIKTRDECRTRKGKDYWDKQAQRARRKHNQIIMLRNMGLLDARHLVQEVPFSEGVGSKIFPEFLEDEQ